MSMANIGEMDSLWREFFREPSQFWDNRKSKRNARSPDFRHKRTHKPLWIDSQHNPSWVQQKLVLRGVTSPDFVLDNSTVLDSIKACIKQKNLKIGYSVHTNVAKEGLEMKLGHVLINMYAKCRAPAEAQDVFDDLSEKNLSSWTSLIVGYAQNDLATEALYYFEKMRLDGFVPDAVILSSILKACASTGTIEKGKEIHNEIDVRCLLQNDVVLGTSLVDMYAKCGELAKAQEVFDEISMRDVICWNALISGYALHGFGHEALHYFQKMKDDGFLPNAVTFTCVLKACATIGRVKMGEEIHDEIRKQGLLPNNFVLATALVYMYAKCGALEKAKVVFDSLKVRDVATWTALIGGYAQHGQSDKALNCFHQMKKEGIVPDVVSLTSILRACSTTESVKIGEEIHAVIRKQDFLEKNVKVGTALLDMYANCGILHKAQEVFDELPRKDQASWNAMIGGYTQNGLAHEALDCFQKMQDHGFSPNAVTFSSILKACGAIGLIAKGKEAHDEIMDRGLLENNIILGTALLDMYAKCGVFDKAQNVFDRLLVSNVVSWNALIANYAQLGHVDIVCMLFSKMLADDIVPDDVTFIHLLTACTHAGLVDEGQTYFDTMTAIFCLTSSLEHNACMVDLFSRAGYFDKALTIIKSVPAADCLPLWSSLLSGCQKWVNVELGRLAFDNLVQLDENYGPAYVCMSNMYADAGLRIEADKIKHLETEKIHSFKFYIIEDENRKVQL